MNEVRAVIGANYGDEGKGKMTDFFCSQNGLALNVRYNGGAQAGHTVVLPDGNRNVFHHAGSGGFAGADTFLGEEFIVNPFLWEKEVDAPRGELFVDPRAKVTTPWDMLLNQMAERQRGADRHGSCGVGIGETMERSLSVGGYQLRVSDLLNTRELYATLLRLRNFSMNRAEVLGLDVADDPVFNSERLVRSFIDSCRWFLSAWEVVRWDEMYHGAYGSIVFEGAQGLLLDEQREDLWPHVTWSRPGLRNILTMCSEVDLTEIEATYVTRAYLTRHGAGPLPHEGAVDAPRYFRDNTNVPNEFQGELRFAPLNFQLLLESLSREKYEASMFNVDVKMNIALTCVDQFDADLNDVIHVVRPDGCITEKTVAGLPKSFAQYVGVAAKYISCGPTREDVIER